MQTPLFLRSGGMQVCYQTRLSLRERNSFIGSGGRDDTDPVGAHNSAIRVFLNQYLREQVGYHCSLMAREKQARSFVSSSKIEEASGSGSVYEPEDQRENSLITYSKR